MRYGRLTSTESRGYVANDVFRSTFCSKTINNVKEAKERANSVGIGFEGFEANYAGKSRDNQTREYFQAMCQDIEAGRFRQVQTQKIVESFSADVAKAFEVCVTATGFKSWAETDVKRREYASFQLRFNPSGIEAAPKITRIEQLPETAFTKCAGPQVGDKIPPNLTQGFRCTVKPGFDGQDVSLIVRTDTKGTATIGAVLAEKPTVPPPSTGQPPQPPKEPSTANFPRLDVYRGGVIVSSGLLGVWAKIDQGHPAPPMLTAAPEFGLAISDKFAVFDPQEQFSYGMKRWKQDHQHPQNNGLIFNQMVNGPIVRDQPPVVSVLPGYSDQYRGALPNITNAVAFLLDASRMKYIGAQARMTGACAGSTVTALPGNAPVELSVRADWRQGVACMIEVRLCSTPASPLFREIDSCTGAPAPVQISGPLLQRK